jgi:putative Mg2+ transporter-C (MgtC) family protein
MNLPEFGATLAAYWSANELATSLIIFFNLLGALLLGLLVGYERSYHGRAAGMRTYGLVCMASAGLTVIAGFPQLWFAGGHQLSATPDPTRVIQGIVTGIGFLGAGVIMKEGFNISGLTTAASIWAVSAIGVLVGVGFYAAAILLALLSAGSMMWGSKLEGLLPSHHAIAVTLRFRPGIEPSMATISRFTLDHGYAIAQGSLSINASNGQAEWHFVAVAQHRDRVEPFPALAKNLAAIDAVETFSLAHARN